MRLLPPPPSSRAIAHASHAPRRATGVGACSRACAPSLRTAACCRCGRTASALGAPAPQSRTTLDMAHLARSAVEPRQRKPRACTQRPDIAVMHDLGHSASRICASLCSCGLCISCVRYTLATDADLGAEELEHRHVDTILEARSSSACRLEARESTRRACSWTHLTSE
ncbi:hypothetical protein B0H15DRAFT_808013 [Mycena belliarum]|uniref:Uncharacterized protein n=1 Tax=Mycena belliarum TaxID=1033014 RepID=A0AAD6XY12_9AGAR|nr:hypothetical protein B0H15DRAFT_808013 [Mycena belliae]